MSWRRSGYKARTRDSRVAGAARRTAGALRETAIESAKDGIRNASEKVGKAAGAGMAVAATGAVDAAGHHPSPLIAVGAAYAGAKVGGLVGKAMTVGLGWAVHGRSPVGRLLAELGIALRALEKAKKSIDPVIDSVNKAQAHFQRVSEGTSNNLLTSANNHCRGAPDRLRDGLTQVLQAQDLVAEYMVTVAKTGER